MDGDVVAGLGGEEGQKRLDGVGDWRGRLDRVTLFEGQGSDLVLGGIGGIVDVRLRNGFDNWRRGVEASGLDVTKRSE